MKKMFLMLFVAIVTNLTACAQADMTMAFEQLPTPAQQFIKQHFPNETVATIIKDYDDLTYTYDVKFVSRKDLEFDKNGEWLQVDCQTEAVPIAIIPANIASYVSATFSQNFIVDIEREMWSYNVGLNNDLDLEFDKNGNFKRIDD